MTDDEKEEMIAPNPRPYEGTAEPYEPDDQAGNIWMRGLYMLILAILFGFAEMILVVMAILQFLWMLFSKEKNEFLAGTGETIGAWLADVSRFQTGATEEKPFPWQSLK